MDNMIDMRNKMEDGKYNLTLEIAEKSYFQIYDDVDIKSGEDLVKNYLISNSDDARFNNIKINYNKNRHTIRITAELDYYNNSHTDYPNIGKLI